MFCWHEVTSNAFLNTFVFMGRLINYFKKFKNFETEIEAAIYYDEEIIKMFQLHNVGTPLLNFPEKLEEYLDTLKNKGQLELKF